MQRKTRHLCTDEFSDNLFWDIDPADFDATKHREYLIARVLEHGTLQDWKTLCRWLSLDVVVKIAQQLRSLEPKALAFISVVSGKPKESFRCYSSKPSIQRHWVY